MSKTNHDEIVNQLDQFYNQAKRQILQNQSAITGLFPANSAEKSSASIKTSLWAASSIFALYLAYSKRVDNDQGKAHDLGQSVVKCMRGILFAWMRQSEKVESFKANQSPKHALHLKFDLHSGLANDFEYPHLQIDVVSLYLIFLANFIASGLDIIYCMDEVTFIQNLVYYVERAYRTPDFGNWEPTPPKQSLSSAQHHHHPHHHQQQQHLTHNTSNVPPNCCPLINPEPINYHQPNVNVNCTNEGQSLEIHATSIGMAKSALEAINGCNLFGGKGANWSIIYSDIDAHSRNRSIFETLLPRESRSKNTDSYLLATISWPCFATNDPVLYDSTKSKILRKLKGKYGLKRFLRDPYGTVLGPELQASSSLPVSSSLSTSQLVGPGGLNGATSNNNNSLDGHRSSTPVAVSQTSAGNLQQQQQFASYSYPSIATPSSSSRGEASTTGAGAPASILRETSFSSTTSGSSVSLGEQPKMKQRKSSYYQRKNFFRAQSYQSTSGQGPDNTQQQQQALGTSSSNNNNNNLRLPQSGDSASKMSKRFEHIESEWPLFICFLIIDGIFKQDLEQIYENEKLLYERLLKIEPKHGDYLMPKYYYVPHDLITSEKCHPDTVERLPSAEGSSEDQLYLTGQSILLITRLLLAGLVHPNELDPLRRHMPSHDRPKRIGRYSSFQATSSDLVVQTVLIAESIRLQAMMANYGIQTQTPLEVEPVQIWSSAQLIKVYEYLGVNEKLGLKGRPSRPIGALGTSKLYRICGQTILCYPLIFEVSDFYLAQDMLLLIDDIQNELNFIGRYWRMSGRPTVCILIREEHLRDVHFRDLLDLLVQFKNGQLKKSGLRIKTGRLQNLISSSCIEHLDFLHLLPHEHLPQFKSFRQLVESPKQSLLLHSRSRAASFSQANHPAKSRRLLCSASSHNLQAIEEQNSMACDTSGGGGGGGGGVGGDGNIRSLEEYAHQLDFNISDASMYRYSAAAAATAAAGGGGGPGDGTNGDQNNYSTEPNHSIDYYECYKEAPTWPTLIELLRTCTELSGQSQLLAILWEREGAKYCVDDISVEDRLERVSQMACQARNWAVVRYCSAVLKRSVESLSPWLTSILVNGKQISLGTGFNEKIVNNPLTPTEIHTLIYSTVGTKNPCDAVLQQEIALYIGRLISTRPDYFEGILTIRVANFMSAMRSYLNIKTCERKIKLAQQLKLKQQKEEEEEAARLLNEEAQLAKQSQQQQQQQAPNDSSQTTEPSLLDLRIKPESRQQPTEVGPTNDASTSTSAEMMHHEDDDDDQQQQQQPDMLTFRPQIKIELAPPNGPSTSRLHHHQQQHSYYQSNYSSKPHHQQQAKAQAKTMLPENLVARSLESLSPSDVRRLLVKVLMDVESLSLSDKRQITGELCRVPKDFYDKVWSLLSCTNVGIIIGGRTLRSIPVLTNMTQDDLNFALKVESMLSAIECPKLRQVNVELLMALHVILERNPEVRFESEAIDLDKIIKISLEKFRADNGSNDIGLTEFYSSTTQTVMLYAVRTVFDCLLPAKYKEQGLI